MAQIWCCCGCAIGHSCSSNSTPGPGTSICSRFGRKTKKPNTFSLINGNHHLSLQQGTIFLPVECLALMVTAANWSGWWLLKAEWPSQFFFFFLGPNLWHKKIPRLGVESELQLSAHTTATPDLHQSSLQCQILNSLSGSRGGTHTLMDTSQICYCWATTGTLWQFPKIGQLWTLLHLDSFFYKGFLCSMQCYLITFDPP